MIPFNQLLPASINGIPVFWQSETVSGGPKSVTHEYPNSTKRFVEFLGGKQDTITANFTIDNENYRSNLEAVKAELRKPEVLTLVLPLIGSVKVAVKGFTVSTSKSALGRPDISVTFEQTDNSQTQPQPSVSNQASVAESSTKTQDSLEDNVKNKYGVSLAFPDNFDDAQATINAAVEAFDTNTQGIRSSVTAANTFNRQVVKAKADIINLVNKPDDLASTVRDLFDNMSLLNDDPLERVKFTSLFFDFGDDFTPINPTTTSRIERKRNRDLLALNLKAGALAQTYNDTVLIEFDNVNDLDATADALDSQFSKVIELPEINSDIVNNLSDLRAQARAFLDDERVTAPKIEMVNVFRVPNTVLTYQYYGDLENDEKLLRLNNIRDVSRIDGDIDILSGQTAS